MNNIFICPIKHDILPMLTTLYITKIIGKHYTIFIVVSVSNFDSVFLTRNAVNRTSGLGCQHSCITFARACKTSSLSHLRGICGRIFFTHTTSCISSKEGSEGAQS